MLTEGLEPLIRPFAERAGVPTDEYAAWAGGEVIALLFEVIFDATTKGWLNKLLQGSAGLIALTQGVWGRHDPRFKRELISIGNHSLGRLLDPKPQDIAELADSIRQLISAIARRDLQAAIASGLRDPFEMRGALSLLGTAVKAPAAPATAPVVVVTPPAPPVTPAQTRAPVY